MVSKWDIPAHLLIITLILWWIEDFNSFVDITTMVAYVSGITLYTLCKGE